MQSEGWLERELVDPEACLRVLGLGPKTASADIFTFSQKLPERLPKYDYPVEWDSIATLDTTSFQRWWDALPQSTRKNVRRSKRLGVSIAIGAFGDDLVHGIMDISNESAIRQGRRDWYFGRSFDQTKKAHSSFLDRSEFICAYVGDELVGFLKLVYRGDVASIMNLTTKASQNDKRPANALLATAVERCEGTVRVHRLHICPGTWFTDRSR